MEEDEVYNVVVPYHVSILYVAREGVLQVVVQYEVTEPTRIFRFHSGSSVIHRNILSVSIILS